MTKAKRDLKLSDPSTLDLQSLFGPPPLIEGEDPAVYEALAGRISAAVEPRDVIEEIWVRDISDNLWEILRLRRLKAKLMHSASRLELAEALRRLTGKPSVSDLIDGWARRDAAMVEKVNAVLKRAGLDQEAILAQALEVKLDTFERIDRMIMQSEARRNLILREIDRHRDVLAQRLRDAAAIEDAEFTKINAPGEGGA